MQDKDIPMEAELMDRKPPISECEWCSKPMKLWVYSQRFCSRRCGDEFHAAERRQAVAFFRAEGCVVETKRMKAAQEEQEQRSL